MMKQNVKQNTTPLQMSISGDVIRLLALGNRCKFKNVYSLKGNVAD
jgi:hypothetical protein